MSLPSLAVHMHHNAAFAVYHEEQITCVIEIERLIGHKNASYEFFAPIWSKDYILERVLDYLKCVHGYTEYNKFILGEGHSQFPETYKNLVKANEYLIDTTHHGSHASNALYQSKKERSW
jgi:hypothetical protein